MSDCVWHDDPEDCLGCGVCDDCIAATAAYFEEEEQRIAAKGVTRGA